MKPLLSQLKNKLLFRQNPVIRYSQRQRHRTCLTNSPTNDNKHSSSSFVNNKAFLLSLMTIPLIYMILSSNESEANKSSTTNTKDVEIIKIPSATIIQLSSNLSQFYDELQKSLQSDQIDFTASEREARGKPWNSYHHIDRDPCVVVFPQSTEDVSTILKLCFKYKVPVIPFGGGTSIEGQTLAVRGGVSLDFSRMRDVVELREGDLDITVQAGLGYVELNEMLKPRGLWFPLDPGPGASVGGMCACRCSGSTALRYGSMRENVLNVTAVLPDGTIIKTGSRARKSSAGYDVTRLLIGSEGTLAVITEATLKLHPIPRYAYALKVCFPSVKEAALAATGAQRSGVTLGRAELMDDTMVNILNKSNPSDQSWPEKVTLLFEVTGSSTAATTEQMELLKQITRCNSGTDEVVLTDPEACRSIWLQRKQALWSIMGQYPDREAMITDACVPLSRLPELISASRALIDKSSLPCPLLAHAGDGNIHVIIMFHSENPQEYQEAKQLADAMSLHAIKLGGTCTGEHGIGTGKKNMLRLEMGEGTMKLMELIKKSIDPENIMNPDKIIDADRVDKK